MDAGAESPKESWLRLVLINAGLAAAYHADPSNRRSLRRVSRHGLGIVRWSLSNTTATTIDLDRHAIRQGHQASGNARASGLARGQGDQGGPSTRHRRTGLASPRSTRIHGVTARQKPGSWSSVIRCPRLYFAPDGLGQGARVAQLRRVGDVAAFAFPRHVSTSTARARPTG